jgi:hypothetical protein
MRFKVEMEILDTNKDKWDDPPQLADWLKAWIESKEGIHVTRIVTDPIKEIAKGLDDRSKVN